MCKELVNWKVCTVHVPKMSSKQSKTEPECRTLQNKKGLRNYNVNPAEMFNEWHRIPITAHRNHPLLQYAKNAILMSVLSEVYSAHLLSTVVLRKALFSVMSVCAGARTTTAEGKSSPLPGFGEKGNRNAWFRSSCGFVATALTPSYARFSPPPLWFTAENWLEEGVNSGWCRSLPVLKVSLSRSLPKPGCCQAPKQWFSERETYGARFNSLFLFFIVHQCSVNGIWTKGAPPWALHTSNGC